MLVGWPVDRDAGALGDAIGHACELKPYSRRLKPPQSILQQWNCLRYGGFACLNTFSRAVKLKDPDMPKLRCDRHIRWVAGQPRATDPVLDDIHRPRHNAENARLAVPTAEKLAYQLGPRQILQAAQDRAFLAGRKVAGGCRETRLRDVGVQIDCDESRLAPGTPRREPD